MAWRKGEQIGTNKKITVKVVAILVVTEMYDSILINILRHSELRREKKKLRAVVTLRTITDWCQVIC